MSYVYIYPEFENMDVENAPLFIDLKQYPYWDGAFTESIAKLFDGLNFSPGDKGFLKT